MRRVCLINFDSVKIPPLPLLKISAFEKARGSTVGFNLENPDIVYCSVIFTKNKGQAAGLKTMFSCPIEFGGSGWDLDNKLPREIELTKPDYSLCPSEYSQGFTTRGCIRNCGFCIVPKKEGKICIAQHPSEFHDDRFNTCMIMDNNLFAAPQEWQDSVLSWFIENDIKMLSPQGWDIRLLTEHRARRLREISHAKRVVHFAWDNIHDEKAVIKGLEILKNVGFDLHHEITIYVLCGYNTTFEQDLYRVTKLRELGVGAYVMPYHKKDRRINKLARWTNRAWSYWASPFKGD